MRVFFFSISLLILCLQPFRIVFTVDLLDSIDLSFALWFSLKFFFSRIEKSPFTFIDLYIWSYFCPILCFLYLYLLKIFFYIDCLLCFLYVLIIRKVCTFVPVVTFVISWLHNFSSLVIQPDFQDLSFPSISNDKWSAGFHEDKKLMLCER